MNEWDEHDAHFTPSPVALQVCQGLRAAGRRPKVVLDLGAGAGALSLAARLTWPGAVVIAIEVRPEEGRHLKRWCDSVITADVLACGLSLRSLKPCLILSNPPYRSALDFTALAMRLGAAVAALLHRSTFGSSGAAYDFLRSSPPAAELGIGGRPQWRPGRKSPDKVPHDWRLWGRGGEWRKQLLPRLPKTLLTWTERPGTEHTPPPLLPPELVAPVQVR